MKRGPGYPLGGLSDVLCGGLHPRATGTVGLSEPLRRWCGLGCVWMCSIGNSSKKVWGGGKRV